MDSVNIGEAQNTSDILVAIGKMQVELKGIDKKVDELNRLSNSLQITEQSVKSAHNRIEDLKDDMGVLKKELLEKMVDQKNALEKGMVDSQKVYDKELSAIRREYDKEMLAQDKKWGERLDASIKPFAEKQKKDADRNGKILTAIISWVVVSSLSGLIFLIQYFN